MLLNNTQLLMSLRLTKEDENSQQNVCPTRHSPTRSWNPVFFSGFRIPRSKSRAGKCGMTDKDGIMPIFGSMTEGGHVMLQTALLNNKRGKDSRLAPLEGKFLTGQAGMTAGGFTLVEVLISLVVLLLVSLALMQTALVGIDSNMINVLRDEAVNIAEMRMNETRNIAFGSLTAGTTTTTVPRNIRNITNFQYSVTRTIAALGTDNRQITITVTWNWKENPYTHRITSIVRR